MRTWTWARWFDRWALYAGNTPVLIVDEVPPNEAQFIVDALNAAERVQDDVRPGDDEPIDMMCHCDRSNVPHIPTAGYWRKAGIS